ncbi:NADH-quinone oxidoreductase subunit NuoE [SCandidatus Aminicenantes bacterium Aminicenantia_JdfR_composite]|jgi:NADH-quinone oxidoreductase subunit E|nr:NADH-quinone oxidoreductase subunit NuoE [SCandidatus Aminicenantes bacterium Aminicenantia_JdfR_composite]MCP2605799.1 NADH-quinone oxidoreductase subunit NuoE [Candidatus Aminicenantes bacterium AC-335-O07]MCP2621103.1 NADH-quinone oxidoreductase subunit NuoE [Candidatus Aminicenantes bacterium AC-334-E05]
MQINIDKVNSILEKYGVQKEALIPILQGIQAEYNYLPQEALILVSEALNIPLIDIVGVATFYKAFSLEPRGKHTITVCLGTACHVRGGPKIVEEFERNLGIKAGETTKDNEFSLETVNCLGCCAIGPVVVVDREYYAKMSIGKVKTILKRYKEKKRSRNEENK